MRTFVIVALLGSTAFADKGVAPKSGKALCVLAAADFKAVGITGAGETTVNLDDDGASAYCTYTGKSSAMGGLELDVFDPAGASDADVKATETTAAGEVIQKLRPLKLAGADAARWAPDAKAGGAEFATLLVRRGKIVFAIGIPAHKDAQARLTKLGTLVLQRLAK